MRQLKLFPDDQGESIETPTPIKTPDDIYRVEIRATFHPDSGKSQCAVEVTHEHSRELIAWKLSPTRLGEDALLSQLREAQAEGSRWVQDLWAPF